MNRRQFLLSATAVTAASYNRILGANDRLGMALVGSGRRGREVMKAFLMTERVNLACLCDVYDVQRNRAKEFLLKAGTRFTRRVRLKRRLPGKTWTPCSSARPIIFT